MARQDSRTALRLPTDLREKMERLVHEGKFMNLSQVIREALTEFLGK